MRHIDQQHLEKYISGNIEMQDQDIVENHLYECERCMENYFELLENEPITISLSEDFTDLVVSKINIHQPQTNPYRLSSKKAIANYVLAAGLTVALMLTGVFQGFMDITNDQLSENRPSYTDQLMHQTNQLIDYMKEEHKQ